MNSFFTAHSGELVNSIVGEERAGVLKALSRSLQSITLSV